MNKKRFFIAINLPEKIKDKIEGEIEKFRYDFTNDIRFLERHNWHITISFLSWQGDEAVLPIIKSMKEATAGFSAPEIEFESITYGPKGKNPRMVWLNGTFAASRTIGGIKEKLENFLADNGIIFQREHRQFNLHITLARFKDGGDLPSINRPLNAKFLADGLDLMESHLRRSGAEYDILQSAKFKL